MNKAIWTAGMLGCIALAQPASAQTASRDGVYRGTVSGPPAWKMDNWRRTQPPAPKSR